jgi:hypothetical protein
VGAPTEIRRRDLRALLLTEAARLQQAAEHLAWSLLRCEPLAARAVWSAEDLERLESLGSRFARLADLMTQRIMRLADELELETPGSLLDRIHRAEKRGWVTTDRQLVHVRELRNLIAHETEDEDLAALYREMVALTPVLLSAAQAAIGWCRGRTL